MMPASPLRNWTPTATTLVKTSTVTKVMSTIHVVMKKNQWMILKLNSIMACSFRQAVARCLSAGEEGIWQLYQLKTGSSASFLPYLLTTEYCCVPLTYCYRHCGQWGPIGVDEASTSQPQSRCLVSTETIIYRSGGHVNDNIWW